MPVRLSPHAARSGRWSVLPDEIDGALLDWADPNPQARVILIGPNRLEMMCALIRRGSLDVTTLRLPKRPDHACADLVVIANVGADSVRCAIGHARRALAPLGSVVIGWPADRAGLAAEAATALRAEGFVALRSRSGQTAMLRAEVAREHVGWA